MAQHLSGWVSLLAAWVIAAFPGVVSAQHLATDGTVGQKTVLAGPNYQIPATLGTRIGDNLFHSFSAFALSSSPQAESATFSGPSNINNIIGRVTGGSQSSD